MRSGRIVRLLALSTGAALAATGVSVPAYAAPTPDAGPGRYLVVARTPSDYGALRDTATRSGAQVVREIPQIKTFVVNSSAAVRAALTADRRTLGLSTDRVRSITSAERPTPNLSAPGLRGARAVDLPPAARRAATGADPGFSYQGLQWDYGRIGLPQGWRTTTGSNEVSVGVADTGLDFTHADLAPRIRRVVDLTDTENPPLCKTFFGISDDDLAAESGGPARTDWNGHGSWIGGNIAAAANGTGINGIAPKVGLVALKISGWCGSAYDSTILSAFAVAADTGIDVVSISFGGYLDRAQPDQDLTYQQYADAVRYAREKGTVIVASAGNEHVRVGAGGRILSRGSLTLPGDPLLDLVGQYEIPGGVPGVVNVSATANVVNQPSGTCAPGTTGSATDANATCKPGTDRHQAAGVGRTNQLSYYSNYGPRIDIAAPGGARKFNLPNYDRGGTPGFPYTTADLTNVWEDFSTTSNWAVEIPCFTFAEGSGFPPGQCYSTIQGTSMAAPHVSAAVALTASAHPGLRHRPAALIDRVKKQAVAEVNHTRALSATDTSPGDLSGTPCASGYCHLEGPRISNPEAYGAGLLNVARP
jgi:subtilisin family serine protease